MGINIEFVLFYGFHVEISWDKGGPGPQSGGWVPDHMGTPLDLEESASHHKGGPGPQSGGWVPDHMATPLDLEESASHHIQETEKHPR